MAHRGIDRAGVGRAGGRDDRERGEAGASIDGNRVGERVLAEPVALVRRHRADAIGHDTREFGRLQHGMMRLVGRVEHAAADLRAEMPLAGADDRVEGRHRSTGREQPTGAVRKSHPLAEPVKGVGAELHERRRRHPDAGEAVGRVGDEVRERGRVEAAAGNVREVAGADRRERSRDPLAEQLVEQRVERDAVLGCRLAQRPAQHAGVHVAATRLAFGRHDVIHAAADDRVGHRAHLGR